MQFMRPIAIERQLVNNHLKVDDNADPKTSSSNKYESKIASNTPTTPANGSKGTSDSSSTTNGPNSGSKNISTPNSATTSSPRAGDSESKGSRNFDAKSSK